LKICADYRKCKDDFAIQFLHVKILLMKIMAFKQHILIVDDQKIILMLSNFERNNV